MLQQVCKDGFLLKIDGDHVKSQTVRMDMNQTLVEQRVFSLHQVHNNKRPPNWWVFFLFVRGGWLVSETMVQSAVSFRESDSERRNLG